MQELTPIKNCIEGVSVSINNNISKPPTNGNFDGKAPAGIRINQENKERGGKSRQNSRGSHKSSGSNPEWWGDQHLNDKKNQVTSKITGKAPPKLDDNHVIVARPKYVDGCESNKVDLNKLKNMQDHLGQNPVLVQEHIEKQQRQLFHQKQFKSVNEVSEITDSEYVSGYTSNLTSNYNSNTNLVAFNNLNQELNPSQNLLNQLNAEVCSPVLKKFNKKKFDRLSLEKSLSHKPGNRNSVQDMPIGKAVSPPPKEWHGMNKNTNRPNSANVCKEVIHIPNKFNVRKPSVGDVNATSNTPNRDVPKIGNMQNVMNGNTNRNALEVLRNEKNDKTSRSNQVKNKDDITDYIYQQQLSSAIDEYNQNQQHLPPRPFNDMNSKSQQLAFSNSMDFKPTNEINRTQRSSNRSNRNLEFPNGKQACQKFKKDKFNKLPEKKAKEEEKPIQAPIQIPKAGPPKKKFEHVQSKIKMAVQKDKEKNAQTKSSIMLEVENMPDETLENTSQLNLSKVDENFCQDNSLNKRQNLTNEPGKNINKWEQRFSTNTQDRPDETNNLYNSLKDEIYNNLKGEKYETSDFTYPIGYAKQYPSNKNSERDQCTKNQGQYYEIDSDSARNNSIKVSNSRQQHQHMQNQQIPKRPDRNIPNIFEEDEDYIESTTNRDINLNGMDTINREIAFNSTNELLSIKHDHQMISQDVSERSSVLRKDQQKNSNSKKYSGYTYSNHFNQGSNVKNQNEQNNESSVSSNGSVLNIANSVLGSSILRKFKNGNSAGVQDENNMNCGNIKEFGGNYQKVNTLQHDMLSSSNRESNSNRMIKMRQSEDQFEKRNSTRREKQNLVQSNISGLNERLQFDTIHSGLSCVVDNGGSGNKHNTKQFVEVYDGVIKEDLNEFRRTEGYSMASSDFSAFHPNDDMKGIIFLSNEKYRFFQERV